MKDPAGAVVAGAIVRVLEGATGRGVCAEGRRRAVGFSLTAVAGKYRVEASFAGVQDFDEGVRASVG